MADSAKSDDSTPQTWEYKIMDTTTQTTPRAPRGSLRKLAVVSQLLERDRKIFRLSGPELVEVLKPLYPRIHEMSLESVKAEIRRINALNAPQAKIVSYKNPKNLSREGLIEECKRLKLMYQEVLPENVSWHDGTLRHMIEAYWSVEDTKARLPDYPQEEIDHVGSLVAEFTDRSTENIERLLGGRKFQHKPLFQQLRKEFPAKEFDLLAPVTCTALLVRSLEYAEGALDTQGASCYNNAKSAARVRGRSWPLSWAQLSTLPPAFFINLLKLPMAKKNKVLRELGLEEQKPKRRGPPPKESTKKAARLKERVDKLEKENEDLRKHLAEAQVDLSFQASSDRAKLTALEKQHKEMQDTMKTEDATLRALVAKEYDPYDLMETLPGDLTDYEAALTVLRQSLRVRLAVRRAVAEALLEAGTPLTD
jgi:hypothetical protein